MRLSISPAISNHEVMPGVQLIWLESPEIAAIAKPGQFAMVRCGEDTLLRRPLSMHQIDGNKLALLFQVISKGTAWLSHCKTGDEVDIFGPLGNGFSIQPDADNLLLVAGGIGIAPLYSLLSSASNQGHSIKILLGARTAIQLYLKEYKYQSIKAEFILVTEDGTGGYHGNVTEPIPQHVEWADQIFACGPLSMYKAMAQMPELKGKPIQVSLEVRMGCGLGVCYGCTIKTQQGLKQVCQDGPVFNLEDIIWEELAPI